MRNKDTLEQVLASTWAMLIRGATHSSDPFHEPVLATGRSDDCGVRTVILRHADETQRTLICYADARSAKIAEIEQFGRAGWLFYYPRKKIQVRIHGPATVHTADPIAEAQWRRVKGFSRLSFCTEQPARHPAFPAVVGIVGTTAQRSAKIDDRQRRKRTFCRHR